MNNMDIPASRWYNVIETRKSRRRFDEKLPKRKELERMENVCREFAPFEGVRSVLVRESPDDLYKGIIGSYGTIRGAKAFIAFIGNTRYKAVEEKVGYTGEGIVLEAEASGLNTCWVGGLFRREIVDSLVPLEKYEKIYAILPFGHAAEKRSFEERFLTGFGLMSRRKNLSELIIGKVNSDWPQWIHASLEAARLAPSAVNRQPWQFLIEEQSITVAVNDKKLQRESVMSKRLCCGIAMLHIETAANTFGVKGKWEFLNPPGVGRFIIESSPA